MTNKPTWETRFHDKFTNVMGKGSIYGEERFLSTDDPRDIENFIDDLLAEQRKEVITELNYTGVGKREFNESTEHWKGRKQGVEEMKSLIRNLIKQD